MNESEVPVLGTAVEVSYEHNDPCEACRGFERHNAGRCDKPGAYDVSGVKLCSYHNAVRGYVPVLYLADGRGMNHAGVVGDPPERTEQDVAPARSMHWSRRPTAWPGTSSRHRTGRRH